MSTPHSNAVVILGASGSVGSALARQLSAQGTRVMLAGRTTEALATLASELDAPTAIANANQESSIELCIKQAAEHFGGLTGIANCIGSILLKPAHSTSYNEWNDIIQTNLSSCFEITRAAGQVMRSAGGSVVTVSSAAAGVGTANHEAIAAAKAGVEGLMRSAASTYANRGIRFNSVAPGLVKSKMTEKLWNSETAAAQSCEMHPLRRLGEPNEVASAIAWLLHPSNSWITGQVLSVDGGLANLLPRRTVRA